MLNKILFLYSISLSILADDCVPTTVKIINLQKEVFTQEFLCYLPPVSNGNVYLVSESCKEKKCEILKREKKILVITDYMKNFGSPGFKICNALGGQPQIFDYQFKNESYQSSERCLFGDKDFVEIGLLSYEWKSFVKIQSN